MKPEIEKFIGDQLSVWPLAAENYRDLKKVRTKSLCVGGMNVTVQFNPCRSISSEAKLDPASITSRPCFLCPENRPEEQFHIGFEGRKGRRYRITLNPYPIFPHHLVISSEQHTPQSIWHRFQDAADFVSQNPDMVCFYNGPQSGASAPDHMHFQACPSGLMPLQNDVDGAIETGSDLLDALANVKEARLFHYRHYTRGIFILRGETSKSITKLLYRLLDCAQAKEGETEPRFNFILWHCGNEFRCAVIFRERHRSHHYSSDGPDHLAMSPGCADMSGIFVAPREEDFNKLDSSLLSEMLGEVTLSPESEEGIIWRLSRKQPALEVGIMSAEEIEFEIISDGAGPQKATFSEGKIAYCGALYDELMFEARTESTMFSEPSFILHGVTIGVGFHWERKLTQQFAGSLRIIVDGRKLTAVNIIGVEDYLLSVISSEMKSSASLEFLKAHAVISRSWVMAQIRARRHREPVDENVLPCDLPSLVTILDGLKAKAESEDNSSSSTEYVKWFDHDDHTLFDVCADDHCQRYQGIGMAAGDTVRKAIDQTWGQVLTYEGKICDARFSKCCGGVSEVFPTCWEDAEHPYLQALPDTPEHDPSGRSFCDTDDESILTQVLNDYDLETKDFFSWRTEYSRAELSSLVNRRSGMDFGTIRDLVPVERGLSGRISRLLFNGDRKQLVVGKELMIRKWLSESHLKSSAFDVRWEGETLVLDGKGWGHGVGLCQIGAAVMASRGYTYSRILEHYYPGSKLEAIEDQDGR